MENNFQKQIRALGRLLLSFGILVTLIVGGMLYLKSHPNLLRPKVAYEKIEEKEHAFVELDSITIADSGFVNDLGVSQVIQNCTQCHSAQLVTQNRMSREGWKATIIWMQETQNLWNLGQNEERILSYLSKNYAPNRKGRRENLTDIEWYVLE